MMTSTNRQAVADLTSLAAALGYTRRGWRVFPCKPGGKTPLTPHGFQDATTDEATIRGWWEQWPDANIAIATGSVSGCSRITSSWRRSCWTAKS